MKKLNLLFLLLISTTIGFAQFPVNSPQSSPSTNNIFNGAVSAKKGIVPGIYKDTLTVNLDSYVKTIPYIIITTKNGSTWQRNATATKWLLISTGVVQPCNGLQYGGIVSWNSGLTFNVTAATYCINGNPYNSLSGSITLNTASTTLPRIDVIGLDTNNNIIKITGTPAMNPAVPQVNQLSQIFLTSVLIPANATVPSGVTNTIVYDENVEWTTGVTTTGVNFNNLSAPYKNLKSISFSENIYGSLTFTNTATLNKNNFSLLNFFVNRVDVIVNPPYSFNIALTLGGSIVTSSIPVNSLVGYNDNSNSVYQNISIPISRFLFTNSGNFDGVIFTFSNFPALFIDYITLQAGINNSSSATNQNLQEVTDRGSVTTNQITAKNYNASGLPEYETNAQAVAANLKNGDFYYVPYNNGNYLLAVVVIMANRLLTESGIPILTNNGTPILTN